MKKRLLMLVPLCLTLLCSVACGGSGGRYVYTNIPEGDFTLLDDSFTLAPVIEGYAGSPSTQLPPAAAESFSYKRAYYFSMNADADLVVAADFTAEGATERFEAFTLEVETLLTSISKALSSTVKDSDIDKFNKTSAGGEVEISQITYEVLDIAKSVYTFTDGCYNPALYYNIEAYGFGNTGVYPSSSNALPSDDTVTKYTALASHFGEINLRNEEGKYYAQKPTATIEVGGEVLTMKLDLGGIGKGYAVDKVDELFDKYGYNYGYFNFGTSSMLVKSHNKEGVYNLSFANPRSPMRDSYMKVTVQNEKFSSSGDSEQYYILDDTRYCHIIDPNTGKPVQTGIMSATVIGGSAAEDDALTTAIMAMGKDKAIKFIKEKLTDKRVTFTYEKNVA